MWMVEAEPFSTALSFAVVYPKFSFFRIILGPMSTEESLSRVTGLDAVIVSFSAGLILKSRSEELALVKPDWFTCCSYPEKSWGLSGVNSVPCQPRPSKVSSPLLSPRNRLCCYSSVKSSAFLRPPSTGSILLFALNSAVLFFCLLICCSLTSAANFANCFLYCLLIS